MENIVWVDLETTGLDDRQHVIIEIAVIVTNDRLELLDDGLDLVIGATDTELSRMPPVVVEMHTHSGLLERVRGSELTRWDASREVSAYLGSLGIRPGRAMGKRPRLGGNSVHMDRKFLEKQMTDIIERLHYRNIDVSTLKETARIYHPRIYNTRPAKSESHRALDDIRESIDEYRYYLLYLCGIDI